MIINLRPLLIKRLNVVVTNTSADIKYRHLVTIKEKFLFLIIEELTCKKGEQKYLLNRRSYLIFLFGILVSNQQCIHSQVEMKKKLTIIRATSY